MTDPIAHDLAELARALAHPHRLALLELMAQGERPVERLAELAGLSMANASQHLQHLRRAGLADSRREGKNVLYRLGGGPVAQLLAALRDQAEHLRGEAARLVANSRRRRDALEAVSREELLDLLKGRSVTLLDVRPADEFAHGHLPQAVGIPLEDLERRLAELPPGREVIAYCRGPYCVLSGEAVAALRARGFSARRLADGFPDWKAAGLPVEGAA